MNGFIEVESFLSSTTGSSDGQSVSSVDLHASPVVPLPSTCFHSDVTHLDGLVHDRKGFSSELIDFCRQSMTQDPAHRPTASQLLAHPWCHPQHHTHTEPTAEDEGKGKGKGTDGVRGEGDGDGDDDGEGEWHAEWVRFMGTKKFDGR